MDLLELTLGSPDPGGQARFYGSALGLPILERTPDRVAVGVGASRLVFDRALAWSGGAHFAFDVPAGQFEEAAAWIDARVPRLADTEGRAAFHSDPWNADMLYFRDADGNVAELIARHTAPRPASTPFGPRALVNLSEVGVPVADVPGTVARLGEELGVAPYLGRASDDFTAVGDEAGLLIVVREGRLWYPTADTPAVADEMRVRVRLAGGEERELRLGGDGP